jgi:hypothetical protein
MSLTTLAGNVTQDKSGSTQEPSPVTVIGPNETPSTADALVISIDNQYQLQTNKQGTSVPHSSNALKIPTIFVRSLQVSYASCPKIL